MLIGISPLLGPDLLHALRSMGHTDEIALLDRNCPIPASARNVIRADGIDLIPLLDAILRILPIDDVVPDAVFRSTKGDEPKAILPVYNEIAALCADRLPGRSVTSLVGAEFTTRLAGVHTVVPTGEARLYANVILRKGVIRP